MAQERIGPGKVPISIVLYIDGTFIKRGIPDMADAGDQDDNPGLSVVTGLEADRNDGISCELGIRYPTLQSIMAGQRNHLSIQVHYIYNDIYHSIYHGIYHAIEVDSCSRGGRTLDRGLFTSGRT